MSGKGIVQEFCLTRVLERSPTLLRTEAVWHEDVNDPGDAAMVSAHALARRRLHDAAHEGLRRARG